MAVIFKFGSINVNAMETDAAILVGENTASGWDSHQKQSTNIGFVIGALNAFPANLNILSDNDGIDAPINDQDFKPGATIQSL